MDKFNHKYRIESHRFYGWNYSTNGFYFITLVIQNRKAILGMIKEKKMVLSEFGKIVHDEWLKSFELRNELFSDEFVIMPNHIHGLVILKNIDIDHGRSSDIDHGRSSDIDHGRSSDIDHGRSSVHLETHGRASLPEFRREPKSISSFVAGFKSGTTTQIDNYIDSKRLEIPKYNTRNKLWQPNYHDHIVRNEKEYWKIKWYIRKNIEKWDDDIFR